MDTMRTVALCTWGWLATAMLGTGVLQADLQVEVHTLDGEPARGEFQSFEAETLKLRTTEGELSVPQRDILQLIPVRSTAVLPPDNDDTPPAALLEFVDTSRVRSQVVRLTLDQLAIESSVAGPQEIPAAKLKWVQFGEPNSAMAEKWTELRQRELKSDLLVIYKGETIDFVDGIVGGITDEAVQFLLDGEEIPVARAKVFGVVFNRPAVAPPTGGWVLLQGGERLNFSKFAIDGETLRGTASLPLDVELPLTAIEAIDFRAGRLTYLSELEPREEDYTPFFDTVWKMRRDRNFDGGPLRLGGRTYPRGLCLHSRTFLSYRLLGEYRRFQAWIGIDELVGGRGDVHLVIKADDRVLFEGDVKGSDPPRRIDADVAGVKNLEILVDFGGDLDISDHLDLADARLVK